MLKSRFGWLLGLTICCISMLPGYGDSKASAAEKTKAAASLPPKATQVVKYESPQAVFDAAKTAGVSEDWEGFCHCLTPESQENLSGMMAMAGIMMKDLWGLAALGGDDGAKKVQEQIAQFDTFFAKHGLDDKTLKKIQDDFKTPEEAVGALGKIVEDKTAFIGEMIAAFHAMGDSKNEGMQPSWENAKLVDLRIDGDTATAIVVQTKDKKEEKEPIGFKKIDGTWLIDLTYMPKDSAARPPASGPSTGFPNDLPEISPPDDLPGTTPDDNKK